MAKLFPVLQWFDNSGVPLAGGKIYTYASGTSTPKTTYKQQAQSSTHTNPIILDGNGRPPANGIWMDGAYKMVVQSSDGLTTYNTLDALNMYPELDWSGLTVTPSQLATSYGSLGAPGTVEASKGVLVDSSKNITTFNSLTATNLIGSTSISTNLIKDAGGNNIITIPTVAGAVNGISITPSTTGAAPAITASGSDSNISLKLSGKGTGSVILNGMTWPTADGTTGQFLKTNGSGQLAFASASTVKQITQLVTTGLVTGLATCSTIMPYDNTIPQNTEGDQVMSLTVTPLSASSTLIIDVYATVGNSDTTKQVCAGLFVDATAGALAATADRHSIKFSYIVASASTSARTYKVRIGPSGTANLYFNGTTAGIALFNGTVCSMITCMEYV